MYFNANYTYTQDLFYTLDLYMITTLKELTVKSILDTSIPPPASLPGQYRYSGTTANKNHNLSIPVAYPHHHYH